MKNKLTAIFKKKGPRLFVLGLLFSSFNTIAQQIPESPSPCTQLTRACGPELVQNGHFENGYQDFDTDYRKYGENGIRLGDCQAYALTYNAYAFHPTHWHTKFDHTYGDDQNNEQGLFFMGDAQCDPVPVTAWRQTINLNAGQTYAYGAWVSNLDDDRYSNVAIFIFTDANGVQVANEHQLDRLDQSIEDRWMPACGTYFSTTGGATTMEIRVIPSTSSRTLMGADFGLDDITLRAISPGNPEFSYAPENPCPGERVLFTSEPTVATHSWKFGANATPSTSTNPTELVVFDQAGTYTITHTLSNPNGGCEETIEKEITVGGEDCETPPGPSCQNIQETCGNNLVDHGDFETPEADDYVVGLTHRSDLPSSGKFGDCGGAYVIGADASSYTEEDNNKSQWATTYDNTTGSGNFLIIDAPCISDGVKVWEQQVTLVHGTSFKLSAWFSNLYNSSNGGSDNNQPLVNFLLNGEKLHAPVAIEYNETDKWQEVCTELLVPAPSQDLVGIPVTVTLAIELQPSADDISGADVGIDDISVVSSGVTDAGFTVANSSYCAGIEINFVATDQNPLTTHAWDFGNGEISTEANPTTIFSSVEEYTVTHTVTNNITGCTGEEEMTLKIENCCGVVSQWSFVPSEDTDDCSIQFTDTSVPNGETAAIDSWKWTFYDAELGESGSTDQNPNFTFSGPGPHNVCLEVTGSTGDINCTDTYCQEVNANCDLELCDVKANFSWEVKDPINPGTPVEEIVLEFTEASEFTPSGSTSGVTYSWTFGGVGSGGSNLESNQRKPNDKSFFTTGQNQITVTLTVTAQNGTLTCSDTYCYVIYFDDLTNPDPCPGFPDDREPPFLQGAGGADAKVESLIEQTLGLNVSPNPFNTNLKVEFDLLEKSIITVDISRIDGTSVYYESKGEYMAGLNTLDLNTANIPSGTYILSIQSKNFTKRVHIFK